MRTQPTRNRNPRRRLARTAAALAALAVVPSAVAFSGARPAQAAAGCGLRLAGTTLTLPMVAAAVGAPTAWAAGVTGAGVDVALIDTGVTAVPGLATPGKIADAVDLSFDATTPNIRYRDLNGHGTSMAGIIAGDGTGGAMTRGVAPGARIVNVKVGAGDGSVDASQVIAAIDWVVQHRNSNGRNIRALNLSYDTDAMTDYRADPLSHAVENAWKAGIVVVVSGGNDGKTIRRLANPANNPFVIAVGGSQVDPDTLKFKAAPWSSSGDGARNPDFVAPGTKVASLRVPGSYLDSTYTGARTTDPISCVTMLRGSGTSQAAAAATGAVALLLQQRPTLTPDQVKDLLVSTAVAHKNPERSGAGLLNLTAAFTAPARTVAQSFPASTGTGSLEASRGSLHVGASTSDTLGGENHAFKSAYVSTNWVAASDAVSAWTNVTWNPAGQMVTGTWMGSSWSGSSWSGSSWSGSSWSGSSWSGSSWSGSSWSGSSWSGSSWSGSSWSSASWSGNGWD